MKLMIVGVKLRIVGKLDSTDHFKAKRLGLLRTPDVCALSR